MLGFTRTDLAAAALLGGRGVVRGVVAAVVVAVDAVPAGGGVALMR